MNSNLSSTIPSFIALIAFLLPAAAGADTESSTVLLDSKILAGFFENHCQKCHGPDKQKGDLRLAPHQTHRTDG